MYAQWWCYIAVRARIPVIFPPMMTKTDRPHEPCEVWLCVDRWGPGVTTLPCINVPLVIAFHQVESSSPTVVSCTAVSYDTVGGYGHGPAPQYLSPPGVKCAEQTVLGITQGLDTQSGDPKTYPWSCDDAEIIIRGSIIFIIHKCTVYTHFSVNLWNRKLMMCGKKDQSFISMAFKAFEWTDERFASPTFQHEIISASGAETW